MNKSEHISEIPGMTPARRAVLETLDNSSRPSSASEIYSNLGEKYDLSTVYRSLAYLKNRGLIYGEYSGEKEVFCALGSHHHHITCRKCGYSDCVPCLQKAECLPVKFSLIVHNLSFSGLCLDCSGGRAV